TPQAIAVLFDLVRDVNLAIASEKPLTRSSLESIDAFFVEHAGSILGINVHAAKDLTDGGSSVPALVDLLVSVRSEIRSQKLWTLSDTIRDGLAKLHFTLEDKKTGTAWKRTS
ncbi:MAG TPA: DALR domain-containing protein, partial [Bacteroidota bacterium]|nr:DALR domain-containing protein [Bacteroidota bacterium]